MFKILAGLLLSASLAHAADAPVNAHLKTILTPQLGEIRQVNTSPIAGLYEVVTEEQIFYTDKTGRYLVNGSLFDLKNRRNLTEARARQLFAIDFNALPLDLALKKVKGNGQRKLAYFTDPNCGFCKKLEHELQNVSDVTLYLFLYPIFQGSAEKVQAVWCSADRVKAWDNLMLKGEMPASASCDTPTAKVTQLGKKLKVNGTPALIFANGVINPGYMPAAEIEKALDTNQ
jgi:thiol:disulfide interchange protein DsbC